MSYSRDSILIGSGNPDKSNIGPNHPNHHQQEAPQPQPGVLLLQRFRRGQQKLHQPLFGGLRLQADWAGGQGGRQSHDHAAQRIPGVGGAPKVQRMGQPNDTNLQGGELRGV